MKYLSICSGIEAATVAFHPLGWSPVAFAEIEPFPCAVLKHHYPSIPNLGDITKYREWPEEVLAECDLLVGGPPCQAFSIAGRRESLADERGNLTLTYVNIINHIDSIRRKHGRDPIIALYENVPGLYSTRDNAFGCLVGALCGQDGPVETETGKWPTAGVLWGTKRRVGYRTLDAQFFGLAQRRRRCFLVAVPNELVERLGDRADPGEILSLPESLRGDSPPSREAREGVAVCPTLRAGGNRTGGPPGTDVDTAESLIAFGGNNQGGPIDVATAVNAHGGPHGRLDFESETFVTHVLRADGLDASADSTGRGTPLVPVAHVETLPTMRAAASQDGPGRGARSGDTKDEYIVPMTLAIRGRYDESRFEFRQDGAANAVLTPSGGRAGIGVGAVAYRVHGEHSTAMTGNGVANVADPVDVARCLDTCGGYATNQGGNVVAQAIPAMRVRRLTVEECESLQGFPRKHTQVPYRGKPAADGNRYKALGNSMAIPVVSWIGRRIQEVNDLMAELAA